MEYSELIRNLMPYLSLTVIIAILNSVFRIVELIARGELYISEKEQTEKKEEVINVSKEINIDKNIKKYFKYKEKL